MSSRPWALRGLAAAGLAVDAFVHFALAGGYDANTAVIGQGTLFRVEATAAIVAALLVLVPRARIGPAIAFTVALTGVVDVMVFRYVDLGAFGPFPSMYEPTWYFQKTVSAVAEVIAAASSLLLLLLQRSGDRPGRHRPQRSAAPTT